MIVTVLTSELSLAVDNLNRRGTWELHAISGKTATEIQKSIESCGSKFSHAIVDIEAIQANIDSAIDLIERLRKTTTMDIIVIAQGYENDSGIVNDIISTGIAPDRILTDNITFIKRQLQQLLPAANEITAPAPHTEETRIDTTITPPSQLTREDGRQAIITKPPITQSRSAVIAVAGSGARMGTTTQAMQILLYLRSQGKKTCLIEMHGRQSMELYLPIFEEKDIELIDEEHFVIKGSHIYNNPIAFLKAKRIFDYVVLDYGRFDEIADATSFLDKDIKIVTCGVKPWESNQLRNIFSLDDGTLNYLFSFVPETDIKTILALMKESCDVTYFSQYSPDLFNYCGVDELYSRLLHIDNHNNKTKASALEKVFTKVKEAVTRK